MASIQVSTLEKKVEGLFPDVSIADAIDEKVGRVVEHIENVTEVGQSMMSRHCTPILRISDPDYVNNIPRGTQCQMADEN